MKTINAPFLPTITSGLDDRLFVRGSPVRAAITRRARRHERREAKADLRTNLQSYVDEGIDAFKRSLNASRKVATPVKVAIAAPAKSAKAFAFSGETSATIIPFPVQGREVVVTRKRPFHRATVEKLLLAA